LRFYSFLFIICYEFKKATIPKQAAKG